MTSGNCAFGKSLGTCCNKCIFMSFQNSEMLPYPTVYLSQYGDPLIRYASDKQDHVTQIHTFILFNPVFLWDIFLNVLDFMF
jgi:hypothetical protein